MLKCALVLLVAAFCFSQATMADLKIGLEYFPLDNEAIVTSFAKTYAGAGLKAGKHYPEAVQWGAMQSGPTAAIDFTKMDWYVKQYQANGFTDLTLCLKSHSPWASKQVFGTIIQNPVPRPEYMPLYEQWVQAVVERYDRDGISDMPGLQFSVKMVEIGSEFSSYEPEPVSDYIDMLGRAYRAAHRASSQVLVSHAAFLTTTVFRNHPSSSQYEDAFESASPKIIYHGLADLRAVLDHPESFDMVNIHSLGDVYEIEDNVRWLNWEMSQRGYSRPIWISDTSVTPFAGWGAATTCVGDVSKLALMVPPSVESDRCRLASFFTKLVNKDAQALSWAKARIAEDHVPRVFISAQQGIRLINLIATLDLWLFTTPALQAGAGLGAWSGVIASWGSLVTQKRPAYFAIKQLLGHFNGQSAVTRVSYSDPKIRVYRFTKNGQYAYAAWLDPQRLILPGDAIPSANAKISLGSTYATIEKVITRQGQTVPDQTVVATSSGVLTVTLTPSPIFIFRK